MYVFPAHRISLVEDEKQSPVHGRYCITPSRESQPHLSWGSVHRHRPPPSRTVLETFVGVASIERRANSGAGTPRRDERRCLAGFVQSMRSDRLPALLCCYAPLDCIDAAEAPVRRVSIRAHGFDVVSSELPPCVHLVVDARTAACLESNCNQNLRYSWSVNLDAGR